MMYKSMRECAEMIDEIEERGRDLSEWEEQFIDSLSSSASRHLSNKQRETIDRIHSEKVK